MSEQKTEESSRYTIIVFDELEEQTVALSEEVARQLQHLLEHLLRKEEEERS